MYEFGYMIELLKSNMYRLEILKVEGGYVVRGYISEDYYPMVSATYKDLDSAAYEIYMRLQNKIEGIGCYKYTCTKCNEPNYIDKNNKVKNQSSICQCIHCETKYWVEI